MFKVGDLVVMRGKSYTKQLYYIKKSLGKSKKEGMTYHIMPVNESISTFGYCETDKTLRKPKNLEIENEISKILKDELVENYRSTV